MIGSTIESSDESKSSSSVKSVSFLDKSFMVLVHIKWQVLTLVNLVLELKVAAVLMLAYVIREGLLIIYVFVILYDCTLNTLKDGLFVLSS